VGCYPATAEVCHILKIQLGSKNQIRHLSRLVKNNKCNMINNSATSSMTHIHHINWSKEVTIKTSNSYATKSKS